MMITAISEFWSTLFSDQFLMEFGISDEGKPVMAIVELKSSFWGCILWYYDILWSSDQIWVPINLDGWH